jgi:hypothetical protein
VCDWAGRAGWVGPVGLVDEARWDDDMRLNDLREKRGILTRGLLCCIAWV